MNFFFCKALTCVSSFRENNAQTVVISKRIIDRTHTNFIAPLRMHFQKAKNTLDSLKRVFSEFGRKPSLGGPDGFSSTLTAVPSEQVFACEDSLKKPTI